MSTGKLLRGLKRTPARARDTRNAVCGGASKYYVAANGTQTRTRTKWAFTAEKVRGEGEMEVVEELGCEG